jgi:hypothetical protein
VNWFDSEVTEITGLSVFVAVLRLPGLLLCLESHLDDEFEHMMQSERLPSLVTAIVGCLDNDPLKQVNSHISVLVSDQKVTESVHPILKKLLTRDTNTAYLARVIPRLSDVLDFTASDLTALNSAMVSAFRARLVELEGIAPVAADHIGSVARLHEALFRHIAAALSHEEPEPARANSRGSVDVRRGGRGCDCDCERGEPQASGG